MQVNLATLENKIKITSDSDNSNNNPFQRYFSLSTRKARRKHKNKVQQQSRSMSSTLTTEANGYIWDAAALRGSATAVKRWKKMSGNNSNNGRYQHSPK